MIIHILRTVWLRYNNALQQRPFVTNTVSAGLIMTVGDSVSQHVLEGAPLSEHNWLRSAKLALWGFTMGGVPTVIWFRFLDRRWPNRVVSAVANAKPAVRHRNIVTKIVVNQCCASTVMNSLFLGWVIAFDRRNAGMLTSGSPLATSLPRYRNTVLQKWGARLRNDFPRIWANSWCVWGPCHYLSFVFVPDRLRVVVLTTLLIGWVSYLSWVGHGRAKH